MSGSLCHIKHSSNTDITVNKNVLSAFLHLYIWLVGSLFVFVCLLVVFVMFVLLLFFVCFMLLFVLFCFFLWEG